tara:strand:- start:177 stop:1169 length:993 start_codon:yes stop_codon:yes gene_type:complete
MDNLPVTPNTIIETKLIVLSSKDGEKLNGSMNSNVLFNFKDIMLKSNDILLTTCAVLDAEIPASYYNVNLTNSSTSITRNGVTYLITVPSGNYNANEFITAFTSAYNTASSGTLTMTFDTITGKFSLKDTAFDITINNTGSNSYILLGGVDGTDYVFSKTATPPNSFNSLANFLGVTRIKILSDSLVSHNVDSNNLTTTTLVDTLGASAGDFGLTVYNSLGRESLLLAKRIQSIDIQIKDQNNNFIDFNFINWNITLILNIHRQVGNNTGDGIILFDKLQKIIRAEDILSMNKKQRDEALSKIKEDADNELKRIDVTPVENLMMDDLENN